MSRFLVINKKMRFDIEQDLNTFCDMAENNPTREGNWQGDGWGISWVDPYLKWRGFKIFMPIWKNRGFFNIFMPSNIFCLHTRTLAAEEDYISEERNMPYFNENISFVFDGDIIPAKIPDKDSLPAEKYWKAIEAMDASSLETELKNFCTSLDLATEGLKGLCMVVSDKKNIYVFTRYEPELESYYQLNYYADFETIIISSANINVGGISAENFQKMQNGEFKIFKMFENLTA